MAKSVDAADLKSVVLGREGSIPSSRIDIFTIQKIHDMVPRKVRKCSDCGLRRMTTQIDLVNDKGQTLVQYLCNDCIHAVSMW